MTVRVHKLEGGPTVREVVWRWIHEHHLDDGVRMREVCAAHPALSYEVVRKTIQRLVHEGYLHAEGTVSWLRRFWASGHHPPSDLRGVKPRVVKSNPSRGALWDVWPIAPSERETKDHLRRVR